MHIVSVVYGIKLKDLNFTPSDECQELRFFSPDEAAEVAVFPTVQKFLDVFRGVVAK